MVKYIPIMGVESKVGARIRKYREQQNMSVADLSAASGVDEKVIAAIEDSLVIPAIGILIKLSRALGQRLGTFTDDQYCPDPIITRKEDEASAPVDIVKSQGFVCRSLGFGKSDRHMEPFYYEFPAAGDDMKSSHEGEEFIICASGQIELTYGPDKFLLGPGDTAYYNSVVTHGVKAALGKPATLYGIIFTPM